MFLKQNEELETTFKLLFLQESFLNFGELKKKQSEFINQNLNYYLSKRNAKLEKDVCGDGNCQFRSISYCMWGTEERHLELRHRAVEWLKNNKNTIVSRKNTCQTLINGNYEEYIHRMSKPGVWGTEVTLFALANVLQICIVTLHSLIPFEVPHYAPLTDFSKKIFLFNNNNVHYSAISEIEPNQISKMIFDEPKLGQVEILDVQ